MDFLRALKFAAIIGVAVAGIWLFREDRMCRAEINARVGPTALIEHGFGSTRYDVVPESRKSGWSAGMPFPVVVNCWSGVSGIAGFEQR